MPPELFNLLTNAGFAGLAVWLVLDTRKEAARREEKLMEMITSFTNHMGGITRALGAANARLANIEERLEEIEHWGGVIPRQDK